MSRTIKRNLGTVLGIALVAIVGCATHRALAGDDHCFYRGSMFSDGASTCQAGKVYRCDDGDWKSLHSDCAEGHGHMTLSRACDFGGIAYSTGSASCQAGMQFRCEDGAWRTLGAPCTVGDAPLRVIPGGRTCMFGDVTVASNSTICKTGTTYLCSDGEWVNLGTLCR